MGCFVGKSKDRQEGENIGMIKSREKYNGVVNNQDIESGYLFVIREASANNEESAFPSRLQSHT